MCNLCLRNSTKNNVAINSDKNNKNSNEKKQ